MLVWMADFGARAGSELQVCVGRQIEPKMLVCAASRPKARQEGEGRMVACMRFSFLPSRPLLSPGACPVSLGRGRCKSKLHLFRTSPSVLRCPVSKVLKVCIGHPGTLSAASVKFRDKVSPMVP